jgi:hypothetical protein
MFMLAFGGRQVAEAVVMHVQTEGVPDRHFLGVMPLVMSARLVPMHVHCEAHILGQLR